MEIIAVYSENLTKIKTRGGALALQKSYVDKQLQVVQDPG